MSAEEYRVTKQREGEKPTTVLPPTEEANFAGQVYRENRRKAVPGETVSIEKRPVGPWSTIESDTVPDLPI